MLRFGALGDIVLSFPALNALRKALPDASILMVTKKSWSDLTDGCSAIDERVEFDAVQGLSPVVRAVRKWNPDVILDLHKNSRTRWLRWRAQAPRTVTWEKRPWKDHLPVRLGLRPYRAEMLIAHRYHRAVEAVVGRSLSPEPLNYEVSSELRGQAAGLLSEAGLDPGGSVVAMSPGATWYTKRWPEERFVALAQKIIRQGLPLLLTGSSHERALARRIQEAAPAAVDLSGRISVGQLPAVLSHCRAFVANDSGPMHVARAVGVPTLAFFGSTDPRQFDFTGHALQFAGVSCSPCHFYGRRRCPKTHLNCLRELTVAEAWKAFQSLLDGPRNVLPVAG